MYEIIYTPQAESQLRQISLDILKASGDYETAENYINGIRLALNAIRKNPRIAPLISIEKWAKRGLRKIHYKKYYAYFFIDDFEKIIIVISVLFDAKDQESALNQ